MLKNFRRVDVLRKYFNTKILQHRSGEECTEREAAMEKFFERNYIRGYRDINLERCRGCVRCFCDGEVHSRKCEGRARARGMARSMIRIVIIRCRKNSL